MRMITDIHESLKHPIASIYLLIIAAISNITSDMTFDLDTTYTWIFRCLSIVSLLLIIIINSSKAYKTVNDWIPKKRKDDRQENGGC